jgi:hypothetical protein
MQEDAEVWLGRWQYLLKLALSSAAQKRFYRLYASQTIGSLQWFPAMPKLEALVKSSKVQHSFTFATTLSKLMKEDSSPTQAMAPASLFISFLVIGLSTHYGVAR